MGDIILSGNQLRFGSDDQIPVLGKVFYLSNFFMCTCFILGCTSIPFGRQYGNVAVFKLRKSPAIDQQLKSKRFTEEAFRPLCSAYFIRVLQMVMEVEE